MRTEHRRFEDGRADQEHGYYARARPNGLFPYLAGSSQEIEKSYPQSHLDALGGEMSLQRGHVG
jgi:hypothetical protein